MLPVNKHGLIVFVCLLFILTTLAITSSIIRNRNDEREHLCLFLNPGRGAFNLWQLSIMLAISFHRYFFIRLGKFSFIPSLARVFNQE